MHTHQPHLSQNFLVNRDSVRRIIRASSISASDTILEIGSGTGIITQELLKVTPNVITVEKDPKFTSHPQDFLTYSLPRFPYKIFSNIPFSIFTFLDHSSSQYTFCHYSSRRLAAPGKNLVKLHRYKRVNRLYHHTRP